MNTYMTTQERMNATNTPYTMSMWRLNRMGPGSSPWICRPPSSAAVTVSPGMPSARKGISAPPMVALFAVSEAMMP